MLKTFPRDRFPTFVVVPNFLAIVPLDPIDHREPSQRVVVLASRMSNHLDCGNLLKSLPLGIVAFLLSCRGWHG